ncbi:MAG: DMT family transporter [Eubacterium sp.]|nr:DMT family transporter [Eubacterium sp.]
MIGQTTKSYDKEQANKKINKKSIFTSAVFVTLGAMVSCFLWGSAYPMIKLGYEEFEISSDMTATQILFAGIRFTLAGILAVLIGCIIRRKLLLPKKSSIPMILKLSMFQTIGQYFFFYVGLAHTTGVRASIIQGTNVFAVLVVASIIFRQEQLTVGKGAGCIIGFLGVLLVSLYKGSLGTGDIIRGDLFIIISTVAYAFSSVLLKDYTKKEDPVVLSGYQFIIGGLIMTIAGLLMGGRIITVTGRGVADLFYLAFVSAVAYTIWGILMKHNPVSRISVYGFLTPIFGVITSIILLDEGAGFGLPHLIALVLVCVGIIVVNLNSKSGG